MPKKKVILRKKRNLIHYPVENYELFLCETKEYFKRGSILFPLERHTNLDEKINPVDFKFIKTIGIGTFGMVYLAQLKLDGNYFAIKVLRKETIHRAKATTFVNRHRKYLEGIKFPFCQGILCSFQDSGFLYMCQSLMIGGDLHWFLYKNKKLPEPSVVFFSAQVVLAIEFLHFIGIVHRNIKPENLLLNARGYLRLTGFSFSKKVRSRVTYTMCGSPEYMAPEMILQTGHTKAVDWWALGVLVYELSAGFLPFRADTEMEYFHRALKARYTACADFSLGLQELLMGLLHVAPYDRLGNRLGGVEELKDERWFEGLDWLRVVNQDLVPPLIPITKNIHSNFPDMKDVTIIPPEEDLYSGYFTGF